jgi:hypothetical protein
MFLVMPVLFLDWLHYNDKIVSFHLLSYGKDFTHPNYSFRYSKVLQVQKNLAVSNQLEKTPCSRYGIYHPLWHLSIVFLKTVIHQKFCSDVSLIDDQTCGHPKIKDLLFIVCFYTYISTSNRLLPYIILNDFFDGCN